MDWEDKGCGFFAVFGKEMDTFWGLFYRYLKQMCLLWYCVSVGYEKWGGVNREEIKRHKVFYVAKVIYLCGVARAY